MNTPIVSVVLCTYNDEKYIAEAIDSILSQSFKDFEFIIWNDGSTDQTEAIVKSYKDERIRYFYHENTGLGKALSLACKEARGKYIARMDGDDVSKPNRLQQEVDFLNAHLDYAVVSSAVEFIDDRSNVLGRSFPWTWATNQERQISIVHPAVMFRTELYNKTCGYLPLKSAQDSVLWPRLIKLGKFHNLQKPLLSYRLVGTSLSRGIDAKNPYKSMLDIIRKKIGTDDEVNSQDIVLHNDMYKEAKALVKVKHGENWIYKKSREEKLYKFLCSFVGCSMSEKLVYFIKNCIVFIFYRNRRQRR